jgi:glutamine phosphoribosylpyrophosphate amidotransferase
MTKKNCNNCILALSTGKKINENNNIDSSLEFRLALIKELIKCEVINAEAVVPIPHAGVYLAACWSELRKEDLWMAFGYNKYSQSMFDISDDLNKRNVLAEEKIGTIIDKKLFKNIIIIDEAIISGVTMTVAIKSLRTYGVEKIHVRTLLPPIVRKCPFSVFKYTPGSFFDKAWITNPGDNKEISNELGADDYSCLDMEALYKLVDDTDICTACLLK